MRIQNILHHVRQSVTVLHTIAHNLRILLMNSNCFVIFFSSILVMSVQISIGFRIPYCGLRIPGTGIMILPQWIPDSILWTRIPGTGIMILPQWILDSTSKTFLDPGLYQNIARESIYKFHRFDCKKTNNKIFAAIFERIREA